MNTRSRELALFSALVVLSMLFAACGRAAPTPVKVIETVVVEKEGETIIETVEVEVTAVPAEVRPAEPQGPLPADGLAPCLPLPQIP